MPLCGGGCRRPARSITMAAPSLASRTSSRLSVAHSVRNTRRPAG